MKKIIVVMFALVMVANEALALNEYGHKSAMLLTEKYLTDKAKSEIKSVLAGSTMVKEAVWLNTLRKNAELAHTKEWHFFLLDENGKSTTTKENDGMVVLEKSIEVLRNRASHTPAEVKDALRTVIHLVVDMHTLSHIHIDGIVETYDFKFFHWNEGEGKASHEWGARWYTLWNNAYLNRYRVFPLSYHADDIDIHCNEKKAEYEKGTPRFWAENVGEDVVRALKDFPMGERVPTNILQRYEEVHVKCMAKASYRLAALLNDIFK